MRFRTMLAALCLAAALALPGRASAQPALLVVVTTTDPQVQVMAMMLSLEALERRTTVRVLLCGPGGELALASYVGRTLQPVNRTPQQMMQAAMGAGATVNLCPFYLPNAGGRSQADLIAGVTVATAATIGEYMMGPEVRYFTF